MGDADSIPEGAPSRRLQPTSTHTIGDVYLSVFVGDIIKASAEAVVSSDNGDLTGLEPLATSIRRAADDKFPGLMASQQKGGRKPVGTVVDVASTSSANYWKYVFTVVCPPWNDDNKWQEKIKNIFRGILEKTASQGLSSVAFPLIGTGKNKAPIDDVVKALCSVVQTLTVSGTAYPKYIEIFTLDKVKHDKVAKVLVSMATTAL